MEPVDPNLVQNVLAAAGERFSTGIILFDRALEIRWVSPATSLVMGRSDENIVGRPAFDLVHPDDVEMVLPVVAPVLEDPEQMLARPTGARTVELPVRVLGDDGAWRWVAVAGRVIDNDGNLVVTVRPGDERHALDRVLNLLGHGEHLDATLGALVDLTRAHFGQDRAAIVHDFTGRLETVGSTEPVEAVGIEGLLVQLRDEPSAAIRHDEDHWICPVLNRSRESVVAALVLPSPRPTGPTTYDATVMERITSLASLAFERADDDRVLRFDASTDHLTGVLNRRSFDRRLLGLALEERYPVAVYFVDLDRFKEINDLYGHAIGDDVLVAVAERLGGAIRSSDFIGRLGGDEFAVACPGLPLDDVETMAQRIRSLTEGPVHAAGRRVDVSMSVGVAVASDDDELMTVVDRSDSSMYRDKHERRRRRNDISLR